MSLTALTGSLRFALRCSIVVVAGLLAVGSAFAQDSTVIGPPDDPYVVYGKTLPTTYTSTKSAAGLAVGVDQINITQIDPSRFPDVCSAIEVLDSNGNPISGLDLDSFCVFQDGIRIDSFEVVATPVDSCFTSIALVIDVSGSMNNGAKIDSAKAAARSFVANMDIYDRVAIVVFSDCFTVIQDFTSDTVLLNSKINGLVADGFTAAFDGIYAGVDITTAEFGSKAVIALSDGMENRSWLCPGGPDGLLDGFVDDSLLIVGLAKGAGIPIFTISLGASFDPTYLEKLAEGSGGFHSHAPTASEIRGIYEFIKFRLCSRYVICYASPDTIPNGDCHTLRICQHDANRICVNCDESVYCEPKPPRITMLLDPACHTAGTDLKICARVKDDDTPYDSLDVKLFWRLDDGSPYASIPMAHVALDTFCAVIPGANFPSCLLDSVEFYGTASDGLSTVAAPAGAPFDHYAKAICKGDPLICSVPNDTTIFQCAPTEVCLPVGCLDVAGNHVADPGIVTGPGIISGGQWCYTPAGNETVSVTVECIDTCGQVSRCSFSVTFKMNEAPTCSALTSTGPPTCVPPEKHVVPFQTIDIDGNLNNCVVYGDGYLDGNSWVIDNPQPNQPVSARVVCYDECRDSCWIDIQFTFPDPQPPLCEFPGDTTFVQCELTADSLPYTALGADTCEIVSGPGVLRNGYWVNTPTQEGFVSVTIECRTECDTCRSTFRVGYDINMPPVLECPKELLFACDDPGLGNLPIPRFTDEDTLTVQLVPTRDSLPGNCPQTYTLEITWIATDICGAADTCIQIVRVQDLIPPTFVDCPEAMQMECGTVGALPPPTAVDNCDPDVDVVLDHVDSLAGNCPQNYAKIFYWVATDDCGNADTCIHRIEWLDRTPPEITCVDTTYECDEMPPIEQLPPPAAFDVCDPNPTVRQVAAASSTTALCPQGSEVTVSWEAMDACGNADTCVQRILVVDTTPPVVECFPGPDTFQCDPGIAIDPAPPVVTDNCDPQPSLELITNRIPDPNCPGAYTLELMWIGTDACGNADTCVTIWVFVDTLPPWMECPPPITLECSDTKADAPIPSPQIGDICDPAPRLWLERIDTIPGNCPQNYTANMIWYAKDTCGNVDSCIQVINWEDTTKPWFTGGLDEITLSCDDPRLGTIFDELPTAADLCDPNPRVEYSTTYYYPGNCTRNFDLVGVYIATDACGNFIEGQRVVHVIDKTPPVITCPPDTMISCDEVPIIPGKDVAGLFLDYDGRFGWPTATDNCDPAPQSGLWRTELLGGSPCVERWGYWFAAVDSCGNIDSCMQVIEIADTTAPICHVPNDTSVFFCTPNERICLPVTGEDNCQRAVICRVISGPGAIDIDRWCWSTDRDTTVTVEIECEDGCGNTCTESFTVTIDVNEPPVCQAPFDTTLYFCSPNDPEQCFDVGAIDPDGNLMVCVVTIDSPDKGTDTLIGTLCFDAPQQNTELFLDMVCTDSCGLQCRQSIRVNLVVNQPPVCNVDNQAYFLCGPDTVCAPINVFDPDDNLDSCYIVAGPGMIRETAAAGPAWCYPATIDEEFRVIIACVDTCGEECVDTMIIDIDVNEAPVCSDVQDTTLYFCGQEQHCISTGAEDADSNITQLYFGPLSEFDNKSGTPQVNATVCFGTPENDTVITWLLWVRDECGEVCADTFTITLDVNEPPVCEVPNDTTIYLCEPQEVCLPIKTSDPDGNLMECVFDRADCKIIGGCKTVGLDEWCYFAEVDETVDVLVRCIDSCGAVCESFFSVTFVINQAPVCFPPKDTLFFLCEKGDTISMPAYGHDVDGNLDSCYIANGKGWIENGTWYYVADSSERVCGVMVCVDDCGRMCRSEFCVSVRINEPPFVKSPGDTAFWLCKPGDTICLGPWPQIDFDHNIMDRFVHIGWMDPPSVCFVPDTAGVYTIDDCLRDSCGEVHCDTSYIVVTFNEPPICYLPNDTTIVLCEPSEIFLPVEAEDPDGNLRGCTIADGPGTLTNGLWSYTPTHDTSFCVKIWCIDECELYCSDSFCVTIDLNDPPVCSVPNDTVIALCSPTEVMLPVSAKDSDGNLLGCEIVEGPGKLDNGYWVYTPVKDQEVACVTIACTDDCGAECRSRFCVVFDLADPPVCDLPNDTTIKLCDLEQVCLPVGLVGDVKRSDHVGGTDHRETNRGKGKNARTSLSNPQTPQKSGRLQDCRVVSGPGIITNGLWCYTPSGDEIVTVEVECTDTCGAVCQGSFTVDFRLNEPPVCPEMKDTTLFWCTDENLCLDFTFLDADSNLVEFFFGPLDAFPAKPASAEINLVVCFEPPPHDTTITFLIWAKDLCGEVCADTFDLTFDVNEPPICEIPGDTLDFQLCEPDTIVVPFGSHDPDGNLDTCHVDDGVICESQDKTFGYEWKYFADHDTVLNVFVHCIDSCGAECRSIMVIKIDVNEAPVCESPEDQTLVFCDPKDRFCIDWIHYDADGNVAKDTVEGFWDVLDVSTKGYTSQWTLCFSYGDFTRDTSFTFVSYMEDSCGEFCIDTTVIHIDVNEGPTCSFIDLGPTPPCLAPQALVPFFFESIDPDGGPTTCSLTVRAGQVTLGDGVVNVEYLPGDSVDFTVTCYDECGDSCSLSQAFRFPQPSPPPECVIPLNRKVFLCDGETDSVQVYAIGGDCRIIDGPGVLRDGWWVYTPTQGGLVNVAVECAGICDTCRGQFEVFYDINEAPQCWVEAPDTSFIFQCKPTEICILYGASDPDGNLDFCEIVDPDKGAKGDGDLWCYTPTEGQDETLEVTVRCVDKCGAECTKTFYLVIDMNEPPVCNTPNDTTIFLCGPNEFCIDYGAQGPGGSDPDNNLNWCWAGGDQSQKSGTYCWYADTAGTYAIPYHCEDQCGAMCVDTFYATIIFNDVPICEIPADSNIFLCDTGLVCFPYKVTDENLKWGSVSLTNGTSTKDAQAGGGTSPFKGTICITVEKTDTLMLTIYAKDSCGEECVDTSYFYVDVNLPPVCEFRQPAPPLCTPPIYFVPFGSSDPENGEVICTLDGPGELVDGGWQYAPIPGEQIAVTITCTDECGATCEVGWEMTFPARVPPVCDLPNDTTLQYCGEYVAELPVSAGVGATCEVISGPGSIINGKWTYAPQDPGTVNVTVLCVSETGCDSCSGSFAVTFEKLPPPTISFNDGSSKDVFLCAVDPQKGTIGEICLPYTISSSEKPVVSVISGPGSIVNGDVCFSPVAEGQYLIIVEVSDGCGSARDSIVVNVDFNAPPVCNLPNDTTITTCGQTQVCLPVSATDADGNLTGCSIVSGPGTLANGNWCYTPAASGPVTVTVACVDDCGAECRGSFTVTFDLKAGGLTCDFPNDTTVLLCDPTEVCLPFHAVDGNQGAVTCELIAGPGVLKGNTWCYTPPADQEVTVTIKCTDDCGNECQGTFNVLFDINDAPTLSAPEEITEVICGVQEVCVPVVFDDQNGNLVKCEVITGPGAIKGNNWCWTPPASDVSVDVKLRCIDACGLTTQRWMHVNVDYNAMPSCDLPPNGRIILCAPGNLCLPFAENDPASEGITCTIIDGAGQVVGNQWCYNVTTPQVVTVTLRCENVCGDVCTETRSYTIEIDAAECVPGPTALTDVRMIRAGDLDNDGEITVTDLVELTRLVYGTSGSQAAPSVAAIDRSGWRGDVNCDGRVSEADLVYLANYLYRDGPAPCAGTLE